MDGSALRTKIASGERIYGTMTSLVRNPRFAPIFGRLGFDYVIVDTEHAPTGRSETADLALALHSTGTCPIIRVKDSEPHATVMALDAGFHGVLVPYCETAAEVADVVTAARNRPLKGVLRDRVRDHGEYPSPAAKTYLEERGKNVVVMIGIESVPAIENLEKILDVGGIDVIFIGPNDLSIQLGVPDDYAHPKFVEATQYIIDTAQKRGIAAGGHFQTEPLIEQWIGRGSRFVLFSGDGRAVMEYFRGALGRFRNTTVREARYGEL